MDERERKARIVAGMPEPRAGLYLPPDPCPIPLAVILVACGVISFGIGVSLAWVIARVIAAVMS